MPRSDRVIVTEQFVDDFDTVAKHYRLADLGELESAKACARADLANAIPTYAAMAAEIRGQQ